MAEPIEIQGTHTQAKIRNPLGVIALGFVTVGIYVIFWYYFVNKEMAEFGKARNSDELGDSPGTSVLAVTLGALLIVPAFMSLYNTWNRLNSGERLTGLPGMEAGLGLVLWIFISPVALYIFQSNWNKVLNAQAGGVPAEVAPSDQLPGTEAAPIPAR
jgi:drug/metabolite transporter (DMT)-like permease